MTINTIRELISAAREMPYQIVKEYNISPIDLTEILIIAVILDSLLKKYNTRLKNREPGYVYDFWADGEVNGEPYLLCPVCSRGIPVPTHSRDLATKTILGHIEREHPSSPLKYTIPKRAEPAYHPS